MTEGSTSLLRIVVDGEVQETSIDTEEVIDISKNSGIVGDALVGGSLVGAGEISRKRKFKITVQVESGINHGQEVYIEILNENIGEWIKITGIFLAEENVLNRQ